MLYELKISFSLTYMAKKRIFEVVFWIGCQIKVKNKKEFAMPKLRHKVYVYLNIVFIHILELNI